MQGLVYSIKDWNSGRKEIDWDRGQRYRDNTEDSGYNCILRCAVGSTVGYFILF